MDKQVDILHPLTTLEWTECAALPSNAGNTRIHCVLLRDKIYVIRGAGKPPPCNYISNSTYTKHSASNARLFISSTDLKSWETFSTPTFDCALSTYRSQLVLISGWETSTKLPTNKIWVSEEGIDWQPDVLPPLPNHLGFSSAVNTKTPEYLIVADSKRNFITLQSRVYVLIGQQWSNAAEAPPIPIHLLIHNITFHNGMLYLTSPHWNCYCDLKSLVQSCTQCSAPKKQSDSQLWKKLIVPEDSNLVSRLVSLGHQLMCLCYYKIFAYSPMTQSWVHVGDPPTHHVIADSLVLPCGDLVVFMGAYCRPQNVFRVSPRVSSCNADMKFNTSNLCRLEAAGIPVLSTAKTHKQLKSALDKVIQKNSPHASGVLQNATTWRLLHDTLTELHHEELSQQIRDYFGCPKSLKEQCTAVIISALLQQRSLEPDQLHVRLPNYVPTMVKNSIIYIFNAHTQLPSPAPLLREPTTEIDHMDSCIE